MAANQGTGRAAGAESPAPGVARESTLGTRAGESALSTDYGNPFDPSRPAHPVYDDPQREAMKLQEKQEREFAERAAAAKGDEYVFQGHRDKYEGTKVLISDSGRTAVGETVKLTEDQHTHLKRLGFRFSKK